MATATAQDDDLLIIADDSATDYSSNDIEFSFDFGDDASEKKEATTDATAETKAEKTPEINLETSNSSTNEVKEEMKTESVETDLGMNFDTLESKAEENASDTVVEETSETKVEEDFSFDLGGAAETETETEVAEKIETNEDSSVAEGADSSMNEILSATIAKLATRKDVIASDKAGKSQKEEEIKAQIKKLEQQVKELEAEMTTLDSESDKITTNIAELEKMKLDPVKDHNEKRVKK